VKASSSLKTSIATLVVLLIAASVASAETVRVNTSGNATAAAFAAGAKPKASFKLRSCRSSAYYVGRSIKYRARMYRFSDTNAPQRLEMKLTVQRRLREHKKFTRLEAPGLGVWQASKESATIYQRDLMISNVEPAAAYKAKVSMRWVNPTDGKIEFRRSITAKPCTQKGKVPLLQIASASAVPVAGTNSFDHTISVKNLRASEAVRVPVAIYIDQLEPVITTVESVGPKQTVDVRLIAPACATSGYAVIDPLRTLVRLPLATQRSFPLPRCVDRPDPTPTGTV
jgi:hypothetical protein